MLIQTNGMKERRIHHTYTAAALAVLLLLAVWQAFGQTIHHGFVNYDDNQYVYENPVVAGGLTGHGVAWAFTAHHANNWHPLTWLSHMLDVELYGMKPGGHHLTNVLLHAAAAILLFLLLWRMTGFLWRSAFIAAVFAVHPLRVESVAWVAERKDLLSGLFFMLTLMAYLRYARRPFSHGRYWMVVGLFALGLMSKPMLVTLPFVLLLLDYWPLGRIGKAAEGATDAGAVSRFPRRVILEKIPLLLLSAGSCIVTFIAQGEAVMPMEALPLASRIANAFVSYMAYIGKLFYPVGLAVFYPHPEGGPALWKIVLSILALVGISAAAILWRRRFPWLLVGWFMYVGMLVPVIGLVQVGMQSMADRYTYLPQIGLILLLTWGTANLVAGWRYRRFVLAGLVAILLSVLIYLAHTQTAYWRNSESLWTHAAYGTQGNYIAYFNIGAALAEGGKIDEAVAHYEKALAIKPRYAAAHNNLGIILAGRNRFDEAVAHYREALTVNPYLSETQHNLGVSLVRSGQTEEAITHFRKALEINPDYAAAHTNLGIALVKTGKTEDAIDHYRKALKINPDDINALNNLAWVRATSPTSSFRDGAEAVSLADRAVLLSKARNPAMLDTLAAAYAEDKRFPEAIRTLELAISLASGSGNSALADLLRTRLKGYRAGAAYREKSR